MIVRFFKYQGTGNDFVILDNRQNEYSQLTTAQVNFLCNRHFGIGADGLMLFNLHNEADFEMIYFNADGKPGSMCGNGARCMVKFAAHLGIDREEYRFLAADGEHEAKLDAKGIVSLKMKNIDGLHKLHGDYLLDTGSPHFIRFTAGLKELDVFSKGREIRYSKEFQEKGVNVNFVERLTEPDQIYVRTYERGVENETMSCGTGVTAAALVCFHNESGFNDVEVKTQGGTLHVEFDRTPDGKFENIWLCGPAEKVFEGTTELKQ